MINVFIIPHFHFDSEYRKIYNEYLEIAFQRILEFLDTAKNYDDFKFVLDQIVLLEPFIKHFPEKYVELKRLIEEGKVEIVCGMYAMADTNIPSGESLIRQILFHKKWLKEKFNVDSRVLWMIDVFGQNAQMPLICKHTGIRYYVFSRGAVKNLRQEFIWRALDGSEIVGIWLPKSYGIPLPEKIDMLKYLEEIFRQLLKYSSQNIVIFTDGGDFAHPNVKLYRLLMSRKFKYGDLSFKYALPSQIFSNLNINRMPVFNGEFNPIFQGVYSSRIKILQYNRNIERKIVLAEKLSTICFMLGEKYLKENIEEAWKLLLFNQFHDIICGCHIDKVYDRAMERYKEAENIVEKIVERSLDRISREIDGRDNGQAILVFNELPWNRTDIAEIEIPKSKEKVRIVDYNGNEVDYQIIEENDKSIKIVFVAENVPSFGYKIYYVERGGGPSKNIIRCGDNFVETPYHRVEFPMYGGVISKIIDKRINENFVNNDKPWFNCIVYEPDNGDLYEYNIKCIPTKLYSDLKKYPIPDADNINVFYSKDEVIGTFIEECGPVRAVIKASSWSDLKGIKIYSKIYLYSKIPRIDFETEIKPIGRNYRLRIIFPTSIRNGEIWHEIPFGALRREEGEYPAQNWIDYSDRYKGIALINDGIPGNNIVDGILALSILKSTAFQYKGESIKGFEENTIHRFRYSIYTHKNDWRTANIPRIAREFTSPLICYKFISRSGGSLPEEISFIEIFPDNIHISALYVDGNKIYMRMNETKGVNTEFRVKLHPKIFKDINIFETNALGEKISEKIFKENIFRIKINGFGLKTLCINFR